MDDIETHAQHTANHEMFAPIFKICAFIRSKCFVKPADMQHSYWAKCDVKLTRELEKFFYDKQSTPEEIRDIYIALSVFCSNGGFVNYSDNAEFLNITVGVHIDIFDKTLTPIILDGTAKINCLYDNERFNIVELPSIKTYKNTTIFVCKQLNGSRHEISQSATILDTVLEFIEKYKPSNAKALIITLKMFEDELLEIGLPQNTYVDHFGNITGTNKYADFQYLFIAGTPNLPENAYKIAYHTYSGDTDMTKDQRSIVDKGSRYLMDADYRATAASMKAAEIIQAINRVRCRKWENGDTLKTHVFMFSKDFDVINLIEACMDGVKVKYDKYFYKMLPLEITKSKPIYALDAVLMVLSDHKRLFDSNKVKKKVIFEQHEVTKNMSDRTKSGIWKKPAILQLVSDGKIRLAGKYIEFLK
ncbi:MAG: hypothetical protein FWF81_08640 [Defluviitaleaceae bacterium]|nr:hypothetical protein [Defluviitaleaceae bacterium]